MAASSQQVSSSITEIAAVAEAQSASTEEVSACATRMAEQVQGLAGDAQQLAATADELKTLVARFQIDRPNNVVRLLRAA